MIRIANCSGFYGDRMSAMREMLEGGPIDYLVGDYLAELTMLILGKDRAKSNELGYAKTFLRQVRDNLSLAMEQGVKIVANAGGLNPSGLAREIRELAAAQGISVNVAHVEGDDLIGTPTGALWGDALTANAYLGAFGIAEAITRGADVVVTGRVTDASVVMGPAIARFGWGREDFDQLAGAVVAGHIIECGPQATGGNFSGFAGIDMTRPLGFPIAEISSDGSSVITKHPDTGGTVSVDTVTAQLFYEVGSTVYLNPDVSTHLDSVELTQVGVDRVQITDVTGSPPPAQAKVALNRLGGYRNSVEFVLTGLDIEAKASWTKHQLQPVLESLDLDEVVWTLDRTDREDPQSEPMGSALLRCQVKSQDAQAAGRAFSGAAVELGLSSYPGWHVTQPPGSASPFGVYWAAYVPQNEVPHVVVLEDGTRIDIAAPTTTAKVEPRPVAPADLRSRDGGGDTVTVPLGALVHARSGDKGSLANIGVWIPADHPQREAAFAWLVAHLDADRVRELLPEAADLSVTIHPFANLRGLNIIIDPLLGEGVASSTRFDPQAKALGEWLRARHVEVPRDLVATTNADHRSSHEEESR